MCAGRIFQSRVVFEHYEHCQPRGRRVTYPFHEHISDVEGVENPCPLSARQSQIFLSTCCLGIADIATVDVRQDIKYADDGYQTSVKLWPVLVRASETEGGRLRTARRMAVSSCFVTLMRVVFSATVSILLASRCISLSLIDSCTEDMLAVVWADVKFWTCESMVAHPIVYVRRVGHDLSRAHGV